tara:strand:+ start:2273 stop:2593 length:321 start_codon:yes stop_codon:yes gene_type:complete
MNPDDLPTDSMALIITVSEDGGLDVSSLFNFGEDWSAEDVSAMVNLMNGLTLITQNAPEYLELSGIALSSLADKEDGPVIEFEPAEELLEAIRDRKIIPFKNNKLN